MKFSRLISVTSASALRASVLSRYIAALSPANPPPKIRTLVFFIRPPHLPTTVDAVRLCNYGLHLCETAIYKRFRSRNVAAVVRCQKYYGLGDLIRCTEPAERNIVGKHLQAFLASFRVSEKLPKSGPCRW